MDRKQWLTIVYREANVFLERHSGPDRALSPTEVEELEPELNSQVQEILSNVGSLEDLIKHSLLKDPPSDLWLGERSWPRVLVAVASACLVHDIQGIVLKILEGTLPRTPSEQLTDLVKDEPPGKTKVNRQGAKDAKKKKD